MWIASPSGKLESKVMVLNSDNSLNHSHYSSEGYGFRPLVCLKAGVELIENANGEYVIK